MQDGSAARVLSVEDNQLRSVLDAIFAFVGLFSLGGVILDVNEAPLAASTLRREDVVGRRFVDMPWFAHSALERARIAEAIATAGRGQRVRMETRIRSARDGAPMVIDAWFVPLREPGGAVTHVVGSGVDITDRKRAEDALSASQARLAEAQRVAHVGSWEWTIGEDRVRWSHELFWIYGIDEAAFDPTYQGFLSRVFPDDVEHTVAVIQRALEEVTPFVYDHRIRRPDGAVRMLHTRGEVIPDDSGRAARLVGSCWDTTERWEVTQKLEHTVSTLTATLEATADGILVGDRSGRVSTLNRRFLAMWRLPSDVGPGADIRGLAETVRDQLVDPDGFIAKVTELYGDAEKESFDVVRFKDGRVFERYSMPQRIGGDICGRVCSFRDVSQREQLLEQARAERTAAEAARGKYESILERVSDGFVALDRSWRYTYINDCGGRLLGRDAPSLVGKHIWTEFPASRGGNFHLACEQALREQRMMQFRERYAPLDRWFDNRVYPSEEGLSIFFTDVTAEVQAQEELRASTAQLRALAARLDAVREEERRGIARELHDQIGQALTALKLELGRVTASAGAMNALIDQTIETTRRLSADLRPAILDDLGLAAAIASQARELERRSGLVCEVRLPDGEPALAPEVALVLFRILQEALTNVARHAQARHVRITLEVGAEGTTLTVADDGRGVRPEELTSQTALGVVGMRERALVVGGAVSIVGSPGAGTTLTVWVPPAPAKA
jgi:PAS domain S-box-containing protein